METLFIISAVVVVIGLIYWFIIKPNQTGGSGADTTSQTSTEESPQEATITSDFDENKG